MGCKGLILVLFEKQIRVAQYCHSDSYIDDCGIDVLRFLTECDNEKFKEQLLKCHFMSPEDIKENYTCYFDEHEDATIRKYYEQFYFLDPEANARILSDVYHSNENIIDLEDSHKFRHSSSCQYCYIIDLDQNKFSTEKNNKLIAVFDLNNLPDEDKYAKYDF